MNPFYSALSKMMLGLVCACSTTSIAKSDYVYSVRFDQSNISAFPGQSIDLSIFFEETITVPSSHRLDLSGGTNGLLNANFQIALSGNGTSQVTLANGNPLYDLGPTVVISNPTTISQASLLNPPLFGTTSGVGSRSVLIGTVSLLANGNIGELNVLSLADFDLLSADFVVDDGFGGLSYVADSAIKFQNTTITMTAVPEPSPLLGSIVVLLFGRHYHRRRQ